MHAPRVGAAVVDVTLLQACGDEAAALGAVHDTEKGEDPRGLGAVALAVKRVLHAVKGRGGRAGVDDAPSSRIRPA